MLIFVFGCAQLGCGIFLRPEHDYCDWNPIHVRSLPKCTMPSCSSNNGEKRSHPPTLTTIEISICSVATTRSRQVEDPFGFKIDCDDNRIPGNRQAPGHGNGRT